jgi:hypothetical protein
MYREVRRFTNKYSTGVESSSDLCGYMRACICPVVPQNSHHRNQQTFVKRLYYVVGYSQLEQQTALSLVEKKERE